MKTKRNLLTALFIFTMFYSYAQYNKAAIGQNVIYETIQHEEYNENGDLYLVEEKIEVSADEYGNAEGNQYDLAVDGAFEGQTIAVLHLYTGEGFDFKLPEDALKQKGFGVYRWINNPPEADELREALSKSCQLWVISSSSRKLNDDHLKVIKEFFDSGRGVYIWGDNQPYYSDANFIAKALFETEMSGNLPGDKVVGLNAKDKNSGIIPNHMISTGLQYVYEGVTIATIQPNQQLEPLIYGSAGNVVTAIYDKDGKRAVLDGGFTRLFCNWDTAGTGRYVKNAAAWLVNYERFGDDVVASGQQ
jgi:hypothetical protein